jgi:outer membrane protein OmpA-like peptidoglycan-associated protein
MTQNIQMMLVAVAAFALPACSRPEPAAPPPPPPAPIAEPAAMPAPTQAKPPKPVESKPRSTSGVNIELSILTTCRIAQPEAYFAFDSAELRTRANRLLTELGTCMTSGPLAGQRLKVVGHADPRGPDDYNKELGMSRAEAVAEYLAGQGVQRDRMNIISRGEEEATGTDEAGWALDRRVDIRLDR